MAGYNSSNNYDNDDNKIVFYDYIRDSRMIPINNIEFAYKHTIYPSSFIYNNDNTKLYIHKFIARDANIIYELHPKVLDILSKK